MVGYRVMVLFSGWLHLSSLTELLRRVVAIGWQALLLLLLLREGARWPSPACVSVYVCVADGPGQLMMPITNPARIYFSALGRLGGFPCRIFSSKDLSLYAEFFYHYVF